MFLKESLGTENEEYDKHVKLAVNMNTIELSNVLNSIKKELYLLQAVYAAYDECSSSNKPITEAQPYWQD